MQHDLTCNQVGALLSFYIEDKLNDTLKGYVQHHLEICPQCREKFMKLKSIAHSTVKQEEFYTSSNNEDSPYANKQYQDFKLNLSAYIDNELNDEDNIRIKKIAISNPLARKDLEDMYTFKKMLHSSFEKTKTDIRDDYSKVVLNHIYMNSDKQKVDPFIKIMTAFVAMFAIIIIGLAAMLQG